MTPVVAVPARRHPRGPIAPLVTLLLLLAPLLAGCLDDASAPAPAGPAATDPAPNPLPLFRLRLDQDGPRVELHVIYQRGDPATVAHHRIDWGDEGHQEGPGAPAVDRPLAHRYTAPRDHRADALKHELTVTLHSHDGHSRSQALAVRIDPPGNRAPDVRLELIADRTEVPVRATFHLDGSDRDGHIVSWALDPGDGSAPLVGTELPAVARHTYRTVGPHTATLTLTDELTKRGHNRTIVPVQPPQALRLWTMDQPGANLTLQDANGSRVATLSTDPACSPDHCDHPTALAALGARLLVTVDDPDGAGRLLQLHGATGRPVAANRTLPEGPSDLHVDPQGGVWIVYQRNATVTHLPPGGAPRHLDTLLSNSSTKRFVAGPGSNTAWIVEGGPGPRAWHLDTSDGTLGPLPVPLPYGFRQIAHNTRHDSLVVTDTLGRIHIARPNAIGHAPSAAVDPRTLPAEAATPLAPRAIACAEGADLCWVAYNPTDVRPARLVGITGRPQAADTVQARVLTHLLPQDHAPTAVLARHDELAVATVQDDEGTFLVVVDPDDGSVRHVVSLGSAAGAVTRLVPHPTQDRFVYAVGSQGWRMVDTVAGQVVQAPGVRLDGVHDWQIVPL